MKNEASTSKHELSPYSSAFARTLRQLFKHGKPTSHIVCLTISTDKNTKHPFGLLAYTEKQRLIFWPTLPSKSNIIYNNNNIDSLDHVTLEFPSNKIHITAYDQNCRSVHYRQGWKTRDFEDFNIKLWLSLMVRHSVIEQQPMEMFQNVKMPISDKDRRINEFENYVKNLKFVNVHLPPKSPESGHYLYFVFYLDNDSKLDSLPIEVFPTGSSVTKHINRWSRNALLIAPTKFELGNQTIIIASAYPSGELIPDLVIGLP